MTSYNYTVEVICPHCGYVHRNSSDIDLDDYPSKIECQSCGEEFEAWRDVEITYCSRVIG